MAQEIIIEIPLGNEPATITVKGVKGSACKILTRDIEAALGKTIKSTPTKEMHELELVRDRSRA